MKRPGWQTPDGLRLVVVAAEATRRTTPWAEIELLDGVHGYDLVDPGTSRVVERYRGAAVPGEQHASNSEATITRYRVEGDKLVQHVFLYHEESTFDLPVVKALRPRVVLSGLKP